ncbi:MAG: hypothetical protein S4CHLAM102_11610 [Chlamydiia bacterium]|nr:hypothetical protein [Chlamydiia bacterium]
MSVFGTNSAKNALGVGESSADAGAGAAAVAGGASAVSAVGRAPSHVESALSVERVHGRLKEALPDPLFFGHEGSKRLGETLMSKAPVLFDWEANKETIALVLDQVIECDQQGGVAMDIALYIECVIFGYIHQTLVNGTLPIEPSVVALLLDRCPPEERYRLGVKLCHSIHERGTSREISIDTKMVLLQFALEILGSTPTIVQAYTAFDVRGRVCTSLDDLRGLKDPEPRQVFASIHSWTPKERQVAMEQLIVDMDRIEFAEPLVGEDLLTVHVFWSLVNYCLHHSEEISPIALQLNQLLICLFCNRPKIAKARLDHFLAHQQHPLAGRAVRKIFVTILCQDYPDFFQLMSQLAQRLTEQVKEDSSALLRRLDQFLCDWVREGRNEVGVVHIRLTQLYLSSFCQEDLALGRLAKFFELLIQPSVSTEAQVEILAAFVRILGSHLSVMPTIEEISDVLSKDKVVREKLWTILHQAKITEGIFVEEMTTFLGTYIVHHVPLPDFCMAKTLALPLRQAQEQMVLSWLGKFAILKWDSVEGREVIEQAVSNVVACAKKGGWFRLQVAAACLKLVPTNEPSIAVIEEALSAKLRGLKKEAKKEADLTSEVIVTRMSLHCMGMLQELGLPLGLFAYQFHFQCLGLLEERMFEREDRGLWFLSTIQQDFSNRVIKRRIARYLESWIQKMVDSQRPWDRMTLDLALYTEYVLFEAPDETGLARSIHSLTHYRLSRGELFEKGDEFFELCQLEEEFWRNLQEAIKSRSRPMHTCLAATLYNMCKLREVNMERKEPPPNVRSCFSCSIQQQSTLAIAFAAMGMMRSKTPSVRPAATSPEPATPPKTSPSKKKRRKKSGEKSPLEKMPLQPGRYLASDFPQRKVRPHVKEQIDPALNLWYEPFQVDPKLKEKFTQAHEQCLPVVKRKLKAVCRELSEVQAVYQEERSARKELEGRVHSLQEELALEKAKAASHEQKVLKLQERDHRIRERAREVKDENARMKEEMAALRVVVEQGADTAHLYCPILGDYPKEPVAITEEGARVLGFDAGVSEHGVLFDREATLSRMEAMVGRKVSQDEVFIEPNVAKLQELIAAKKKESALMPPKKERRWADTSFICGQLGELQELMRGRRGEHAIEIQTGLEELLFKFDDELPPSHLVFVVREAAPLVHTLLEQIVKMKLITLGVPIRDEAFEKQRVSMASSHRVSSLFERLQGALKRDNKELRQGILNLNVDALDMRYAPGPDESPTSLKSVLHGLKRVNRRRISLDSDLRAQAEMQAQDVYQWLSSALTLARVCLTI